MAKRKRVKTPKYVPMDIDAYRKRKREYARTPAEVAKRRAYQRKWRENNREYHNKYYRKYHYERRVARTPEQRHAEHIKGWYGLSVRDYAEMLQRQGNRCAICSTETPGGHFKKWAVDHCHTEHFVRGLLCNWCNARLGWYEVHAKKAAEYLANGSFVFSDGNKRRGHRKVPNKRAKSGTKAHFANISAGLRKRFPRAKLKCKHCEKIFEIKQASTRGKNQKYCSCACAGKAARGTIRSDEVRAKISRSKKEQWDADPKIRKMGLDALKRARAIYQEQCR